MKIRRGTALILPGLILLLGIPLRVPPVQATTVTKEADLRRKKLFELTAEKLALTPTAELPHVWGLVMERTFPETVITIYVSLGRNANIYYGTGGKITGYGKVDKIEKAQGRALLTAESLKDQFEPTDDFRYPAEGQVNFYLFTYSGIVAARALEKELRDKKHPLSPLYLAVDDMITEIRLASEAIRARAPAG